MSNEISTRIKLKRDTEANWEAAKNKTILNGEVVLVDTSDGRLRAKIGGENTTYEQLEFIDNIHIITEENKDEKIPANVVIVIDTTVGGDDGTVAISPYMPNVVVDADDNGKVLMVTDGTWAAMTLTKIDGKDGEDGVDGKDGFSPIITTSQIDGGHTVLITDASGTPKSFNVLNGTDGKDGTSITHAWEGTVLKVTSAGETTSADLKGEKGDPFEYADFTEAQLDALKPVKGTDYFDGEDYILTEADKTEIANETKGLLDDTVQEMREIASGKCQADAFDTVEAMTTWLNTGDNASGLKLGDVFYIRDVGVPDYWWEPIREGVTLSKYTEKDVVISGKGAARILETTKVVLDDYALKSELPTSLPANGGNAATVGGKSVVTATSAPTVNDTSVITIVI